MEETEGTAASGSHGRFALSAMRGGGWGGLWSPFCLRCSEVVGEVIGFDLRAVFFLFRTMHYLCDLRQIAQSL